MDAADSTQRLAALSAEDRGFVLGASFLAAASDALAGLTPEARNRCAAALASLAQESRENRALALADLARGISGAIVPVGLERLHSSWLMAVLDAEPPGIVGAVSEMLPASVRQRYLAGFPGKSGKLVPPAVAVELTRFLLEPLAPFLVVPEAAVAVRLCLLPPDDLESELGRMGAVVFGQSLAGATAERLAASLMGVGARYRDAVATAAASPWDPPTCEQARRIVREADVAEAAADVQLETKFLTERRILRIGAKALQPQLSRADAFVVAGRLPRWLGISLMESSVSEEESIQWGA